MTVNEKQKTQVETPTAREIVVTRTFDAPRELVWKMWTQAEHLIHWWGPTGWTLPVCEMDFRPGGSWFYCMEGPDGMKSCGITHYSEIDEPDRIVMTDSFADAEGNPNEDMPVSQITVEFFDLDGKTKVVSTSVYPTQKDRDAVIEMGMEAGITQTLDRLEAYLQTVS